MKALNVKPGITIARVGGKTVTFIKEGMKGRTLRNLSKKHADSLAIARQVVETVTA